MTLRLAAQKSWSDEVFGISLLLFRGKLIATCENLPNYLPLSQLSATFFNRNAAACDAASCVPGLPFSAAATGSAGDEPNQKKVMR